MAASVSGLGSASVSSVGNVQTTALSGLNTTMFVQLQAIDARGAGEWTDAVQAMPGLCAGTVLNLRTSGQDCTGRSIAPVLWNSSLNAPPNQYFEIEERRGPLAQFTGLPNVASTPATSYQPIDMPPSAPDPGIFDLFISVRACISKGNCSTWSAPLQFYAGGDQCTSIRDATKENSINHT